MSFTVAILGRPNVGKSTLFNRLVGKRLALVDDTPGVTRDRREGLGRIGDLQFNVVDTAGLEEATGESLEAAMRQQTDLALEAADVVLLLIDARAGVTPLDKHFADWLRRSEKPVILLANKCEGAGGETGYLEAFSLGLGEPLRFSAEHGDGLSDLYDVLAPYERDEAAAEAEADENEPVRIAVAGRPNVGKSTLINRLLGEDRLLTGPTPGVTRDSIAVDWQYQGRRFKLVDTAGMRRRAKVQQKLEKLSVADAIRAVDMAQVVVLLVDADQPLEKQDLVIASRVMEEGRALVVGVNKWDTVTDREACLRLVRERLADSLPQARGVPVVTLSALTGKGVDRLIPAALSAYDRWNKRLPTAALNRWLEDVVERHPPPAVRGRHIRLRYVTQPKTRPPTFALFASRPDQLPDSYIRYLSNSLRENFDLPGVPIRISLRKGKNPYA